MSTDKTKHGPFWPSDYVPGEDPSCVCGYNGTPEECAASRTTPTPTAHPRRETEVNGETP